MEAGKSWAAHLQRCKGWGGMQILSPDIPVILTIGVWFVELN